MDLFHKMDYFRPLVGLVLVASFGMLHSQTIISQEKWKADGQVYTKVITDKDTMFFIDLQDVVISSRKFTSDEDYQRYLRYKRYAAVVYPYAVEAIRIFREVESVTPEMRRGEKRKYIRQLHRDLKEKFSDRLKNLSKTQGKILVKMIEKEVDTPLYFLLKDLKGGFNATYWNTLGSFYGYELKHGYVVGEDPILDAVLKDYRLSPKS